MATAHSAQRILRTTLVGSLLAACVIAVAARIRYVQPTTSPRFGHYTAEQILERSEPLCRSIRPDAGRLVLSAEPLTMHGRAQTVRRFWHVTCLDEAGTYVCNLLWNAEAAGPCSIGCRTGQSNWYTRQPLSRDSAVAAAARWLRVFCCTSPVPAWALASEPEPTSQSWYTYWRAGSRAASVAIDAHTGGVVKIDWFAAGPAVVN